MIACVRCGVQIQKGELWDSCEKCQQYQRGYDYAREELAGEVEAERNRIADALVSNACSYRDEGCDDQAFALSEFAERLRKGEV